MVVTTKINSIFLIGKSFHSLSVYEAFKSGEHSFMTRLNEGDKDHSESLLKLKNEMPEIKI